MAQTLVEAIRDKVAIEDIVGQYVELKRFGDKYKGRSPFTNEKTPSFFVSPDKNLFYCFSSQKGGDVFTFIQEIEGVDFLKSVEILADKLGLDKEEYKGSTNTNKKDVGDLYEVLNNVNKIFLNNITSKEISYLEERGLNENSIKVWDVGFALNSKDSVLKTMKSKGYDENNLFSVGVIKRRDDGNLYDVFRNRITFPIKDTQGRIVGFSGRDCSDFGPKYLNSPETKLFHKSEILYGFFDARDSIRKNDFSIITEGQFDVILSHQIGFKNTIALSGTVFKEETLNRVSRLSKNIILALDSDAAGMRSSLKIAKIALSLGMNVKSVKMSEGEDPADVIKRSPELWKKMIREAVPFITFYVDYIRGNSKDDSSLYNNLYETIIPLIISIKNPIEKGNYMREISNVLSIDIKYIEEAVEHVKKETKGNKVSFIKKIIKPKEENQTEKLLSTIEDAILFLESKDVPLEGDVKEKIEKIFDYYSFEKKSTLEKALIRFDVEVSSNVDKVQKVLFSNFNYLYSNMLKKQLESISKRMNMSNDDETFRKEAESFQHIVKELEKYKVE